LVNQGRLADLDSGPRGVFVRTPTPERLRDALATAGLHTDGEGGAGQIRVLGGTPEQVGRAAFEAQVELHELVAEASDLEKVFLAMTETAADDGQLVAVGQEAARTEGDPR
jgi:ABC-2 type transport system ATP-binding protein